jgi:motility quorum-sensing regulator/GCU-specific mRNA interferase toxin
MVESNRPTYDLAELQRLVREGAYMVTMAAVRGAAALSFDGEDVRACVLGLTRRDLYKTMPATDVPGLWQDVYRPVYLGVPLYVKLQLSRRGKTVVIQFKQK